MNVTTEDFLKELRTGADLDSIGRELADMMNEAKELHEKEELERIQKEKEEDKLNIVGDMVEAVAFCLGHYYPTLFDALFLGDEIDIDKISRDVMGVLDLGEELYKDPMTKEIITALGNTKSWLGLDQKVEKKGRECPSASTKNSFMDILNSFLDE